MNYRRWSCHVKSLLRELEHPPSAGHAPVVIIPPPEADHTRWRSDRPGPDVSLIFPVCLGRGRLRRILISEEIFSDGRAKNLVNVYLLTLALLLLWLGYWAPLTERNGLRCLNKELIQSSEDWNEIVKSLQNVEFLAAPPTAGYTISKPWGTLRSLEWGRIQIDHRQTDLRTCRLCLSAKHSLKRKLNIEFKWEL